MFGGGVPGCRTGTTPPAHSVVRNRCRNSADNGHQKHEAPGHRDISDICRPHLVGIVNDQIPEQVGIDFMLRPHQTHQPLNMLPVKAIAQSSQMSGHGARSVKRRLSGIALRSNASGPGPASLFRPVYNTATTGCGLTAGTAGRRSLGDLES